MSGHGRTTQDIENETLRKTKSLEQNCFQKPVRCQSKQEPMLASFYHATIIKHDSLCAALSYILANKLNTASMPAMAVREVVEEAFAADPTITDGAACDIWCHGSNRDPAVSMYSMPLLYLKGYHALQGYRVANWLWKQGRHALADLPAKSDFLWRVRVDIHPAARIGSGIMLDHATGIVIGETAVVENDVSILQDVTLGGTGKECGDRHPKIREGVMIGAGAKILGNIEVGQGAKIGSCSVVLQAVPPPHNCGWCACKNRWSSENGQTFSRYGSRL